MNPRRLLSLLALCALLAVPFAHMDARAHDPQVAMAGHCAGDAAAPGKADRTAIDCAIACAVIAPTGPPPIGLLPIAAAGTEPTALPSFSGIRPEADPPPPRTA